MSLQNSQREDILLTVDGDVLTQTWTEVRVVRTLDEMTPTFEFHATQRNPFEDWLVYIGSECAVTVNGLKIITGYIEDVNPSFSEKGHEVVIAGRGKTCDIVDSCRTYAPYYWPAGTPIISVIRDLVQKFDIDIMLDSSAASLVQVGLESGYITGPGAPLMECITKLTRLAGVLPNTYPSGDLLLTTAGAWASNDALMTGWNIKAGALKQSNRDRFQWYVAKGVGTGADTKMDQDYINIPLYKVKDPVITRYRTLCIMAEGPTNPDLQRKRAMWESKYRAGKSREFEYTVQGCTMSNGLPWEPNMTVQVVDDVFGVNDTLLINSVEYNQSSTSGTWSKIGVCSKEKWVAEAQLEKIATKWDLISQGTAGDAANTKMVPD